MILFAYETSQAIQEMQLIESLFSDERMQSLSDKMDREYMENHPYIEPEPKKDIVTQITDQMSFF